jgi:L-ascorbate metabolism protein UlaG (beta-lactamase superfamily)
MKPKIKKVICSLGTGEHLEYWGFDKDIIVEKDWNENIPLDSGFVAHTTPARHFSGRGFKRNQALWTSFVLKTPSMNLFIGGDSGYDTYFAEIGRTFGEFDLVILENGQYDKKWKYIHMMPEDVLQAAFDLKAKSLLPVHSSKFAIANHPWDDPLSEVSRLNKDPNLRLITPMIGEQVNLKDTTQQFSQWWEGIK